MVSSIHRERNGHWRARYRDRAGRSRSKTFVRKADAQGSWTRSAPTCDEAPGWTHNWPAFLRGLGGPLVADDGHTTSHDPPRLLGHFATPCPPLLQGPQLSDIDYMDVEEFIAHLVKRGLSPKFARDCTSVLSLIMKSAVKANLRKDNPAADHHIPIPRPSSTKATC